MDRIAEKAQELLKLVSEARDKCLNTEEWAHYHSLLKALESFLEHRKVRMILWPVEPVSGRDWSEIPFTD